MHPSGFYADLERRLDATRREGLFKSERVIVSRQGSEVTCDDGVTRINLCSNNYLGLSGQDDLVDAGIATLRQFGYGMSSVRFICGTQSVPRDLEKRLAQFLGTEDAILYAARRSTPTAGYSRPYSTPTMP